MSNKKVSSQLRNTYTQPYSCSHDSRQPTKRERKAARDVALDLSAAGPAIDSLTRGAHRAPVASRSNRQALTPATLLKVGVAALLWTSGTQARHMLASNLMPASAPVGWDPEAPFSAPVAASVPSPTDTSPAAAPVQLPYNPFSVAKATQNANLMGSSRNATVFNRDANGNVVIKAVDVHQDIVHEGDCQTLSVLASVAHKNPDLISQNLKYLGRDENGDNIFAVKIFVDDTWTTQTVTDVDLPGLGALQKTDVIWPRLYERALMQAFPNDDVLNKALVDPNQPSSGKPSIDTGKVLHAVTSQPLQEGDGDAAGYALLQAVFEGTAATAGVAEGDLSYFGTFDTVDAQTGAKVDVDSPNAVTILGSHQYAALNVTGASPNRQVELFNPYNYPGSGGSTFTVSEAVFRQYWAVGLAWT